MSTFATNLAECIMASTREDIYNNVRKYLEEGRGFLDTEISLAKLSRIVGTNTAYLSSVLNERFGRNFKTLISDYRVEFAKQVIIYTDDASFETGNKCGFTSRSSYYEVFRKKVGITPHQFLKEYKNSKQ